MDGNPDYHGNMYNAVCYLCLQRIHVVQSNYDKREPEPHNCKPYLHTDGKKYTLWYHNSCEERRYVTQRQTDEE